MKIKEDIDSFDLSNLNICMKICIRGEDNNEDIKFIYSNTKGIDNLKETLQNNPIFSDLVSPAEILYKMAEKLVYNFSTNEYTGFQKTKWLGGQMLVHPNESERFNSTFKGWKLQLENLVGSENIFEVTIPSKEFEEAIDKNQKNEQFLLNYLQAYRLEKHLEKELKNKEVTIKRNKV